MGQVFKARHVQLGKVFALKIIAPAFADNEHARERFNEEARLASQISHPNIVSVVDYGEDPLVGAYMVMELVEGVPLLAPDARPFSVKRALDVLGQIADVLDHIHRAGIVHGDIKADNVLLIEEHDGPRRREVVRVLDFGLAQRHGTQRDQVDATPHYAAPERCQGGRATVATDIYALGVLGYELLAGMLPFDGTVVEILMAHVHDEPTPVSEVRGEPVDPAIDALIARAMAKDPAERHASAAAFRYELNNVMDMLALTRRRRSRASIKPINTRDTVVGLSFDKSSMPQAVIGHEGVITVANDAFAQLVGTESIEGKSITETALSVCVPELVEGLRAACEQARPLELRSRVRGDDCPPLDLTVWLVPFAGDHIHMLVRCESLAS